MCLVCGTLRKEEGSDSIVNYVLLKRRGGYGQSRIGGEQVPSSSLHHVLGVFWAGAREVMWRIFLYFLSILATSATS